MPSLVPVVNSFEDSRFAWLNHPEEWTTDNSVVDEETEGAGGKIHRISSDELVFQPPAKKDFWSRTFYTPLVLKHDASGFLYPIPGDVEATVSVKLSFNAIEQFDQAGLFIYVDNDHWVKCGIEFCDSLPRLSVVVCNGGFSDWSTQVWSSTSAYLKVHKVLQSSSLVVEAAPVGAQDDASQVSYQFVRIAHLGAPSSAFKADDVSTFPVWRVGPFAACPIAQRGCTARFDQFSIGPRQAASHESDW